MKNLKFTQKLTKKLYIIFLFLAVALLIDCGKNGMSGSNERPFLNVLNGHFNVNVIIVDLTDDGSGQRGSGTLSFDFAGDNSGSFSASGPLTTGQVDQVGVGAVITEIENSDFDRFDEVISLLAFNPIGNGKADVFILGTTTPVDSLEPGFTYIIDPLGPFTTALFLNGIGIEEFWAGQTNLLEAADSAFFLEGGFVSINARNGANIRGTFEGTTHTGQGSFLRKIRN